MKNIINITELLKGMCIIGLYYLLAILYTIPFTFISDKMNLGLINLLHSLLMVMTFVLIYHKDLIKDFKDYKKNFKSCFKIGFNYWFKGLFIMVASSFFLSLFNLGLTTNEEANRSLIFAYPLFEIPEAVIIAPLLEELVFRRSLKKFTTNIHIYAFTTGIIFGGIHIISSLTNPINLLFLIPYSAMGVAFGYAYFKTNNIYTTISVHSMHNLITIIEYFILGGLLWPKKLDHINLKN